MLNVCLHTYFYIKRGDNDMIGRDGASGQGIRSEYLRLPFTLIDKSCCVN